MKREIFKKFLVEKYPEKWEELLLSFENYWKLLVLENAKINLISRKTGIEDYWTVHFLDSLLPIDFFDFSDKKILDLGTGGGLPGIPLKILFPKSEMYLLDSKQKKINSLKNIIKKLDLKRCFTIVSRLEDLDKERGGFFDFIVCRSVKILPKYRKKMFEILHKNGKIILYKSKILDDLKLFEKYKIYDVSQKEIGVRKIIEIEKE